MLASEPRGDSKGQDKSLRRNREAGVKSEREEVGSINEK